jgi:lambda repressor-like predicted transcriptional regulator
MVADVQYERIKWALKMRGSSLADIARKLNVQPSTVSLVCKGRGRSRRIESAIAATIGFDAARLWPDNYPSEKGDDMAT